MSTTFTRNLRHLMDARSWSTAELGRRIADHEELDTSGSIRKARRMAVGLQSPKLPDVETLAAIFQVEPADLAWTDFDEALKDMSPPTDLGVPRSGSPAGWSVGGGTPPGGSHEWGPPMPCGLRQSATAQLQRLTTCGRARCPKCYGGSHD